MNKIPIGLKLIVRIINSNKFCGHSTRHQVELKFDAPNDNNLPKTHTINEAIYDSDHVQILVEAGESIDDDFKIRFGEDKKTKKLIRNIEREKKGRSSKINQNPFPLNDYAGASKVSLLNGESLIATVLFSIMPSKLSETYFERMINETSRYMINDLNKISFFELEYKSILAKKNTIDDQLLVLQKYVDKLEHLLDKIILKPLLKSEIKSLNYLKHNHKISHNYINKMMSKKGATGDNREPRLRSCVVPLTVETVDLEILQNVCWMMNEIIERCEIIENQIVTISLSEKHDKKNKEKVRSFVSMLQRKKSRLKIKYSLNEGKIRSSGKFKLCSWKESNNIHLSELRAMYTEFDSNYAKAKLKSYGDLPLDQISNLYELWVLIKIHECINKICQNGLKPLPQKIISAKSGFRGSFSGGEIHLLYEPKIKNKRNSKNDSDKNLTYGLLRENLDKKPYITPDYVIYIFENLDNIESKIIDYNSTPPDKIIVFDAKYTKASNMTTLIKELVNSSYDQIGVYPNDNRAKHLWLFSPGVTLSNDDISYSKSTVNMWGLNELPHDSPTITTSGWVGLRPAYHDNVADSSNYNIDVTLTSFIEHLFRVEGLIQ